ncbi:kinase domain-containing protein [Salix suchowensis]|nr:kinase domain-containing protein [Salix suchowensis]
MCRSDRTQVRLIVGVLVPKFGLPEVTDYSLASFTVISTIQGVQWPPGNTQHDVGRIRCSYLGIEVAIKEVLPSTEYDVAKYFEREWRLMKEARHPNVVLYLGLSRAPDPDGRIFIISEFIENGNLRSYIFDKTKPFPWRLRISFATDIARALAYCTPGSAYTAILKERICSSHLMVA